jgi:hypothetical protein
VVSFYSIIIPGQIKKLKKIKLKTPKKRKEMKSYTNQELETNYKKFLGIVDKYITGERKEKLLKMYSMDELGPNLMLSPASGNKNFHYAYEGGYIDHIFNVCKHSLKMKNLFVECGGTIDFTDEELIFSALHHDLGKLGTKGFLHYVKNDSDWHIKNRGEYFKRNEFPICLCENLLKRNASMNVEIKFLNWSKFFYFKLLFLLKHLFGL